MEILIEKNGSQLGPYDERRVRRGIDAGEFALIDSACENGSDQWKPLGDLIDTSRPPPVPPTAILPTVVTAEKGPASASPFDPLASDYGTAFGMEDAADLGVERTVRATINSFRSLDYGFLIPCRKILSRQLFQKKAVRWVLLFGLLPIAILQLVIRFDLSFFSTIWLIEVYFCLFWAFYFYSVIQPSKMTSRRAVGYALFTAILGIPILLLLSAIPFINSIHVGTDSSHFLVRLGAFLLTVGPLDEFCKALPLLLFGLRRKTFTSIRQGVFLGFMSGLGFAAAEGVEYNAGSAWDIIQSQGAQVAFTASLLQNLFRLMSGPLLHGAWSGIPLHRS